MARYLKRTTFLKGVKKSYQKTDWSVIIMKIGVVTIFDCVNNSGAFLQAYALKFYLEEQGHTVYHIVKDKKDNFVNSNIRRLVHSYSPSGSFIIKSAKRAIKVSLKFLELKYKSIVCSSEFKKMNTLTVEEVNKVNLDLVICGSDEIWNLNNEDLGDEFYFAQNIKSKKKITYAISCGNSTAEQFKEAVYPVDALPKFDKILVRDEQTKRVIEEITEAVPDIVCDPTILVDTDLLRQEARTIRKKYMIVYSYGVCGNIKEHIRRYANEKGLTLVSLVMEQNFTDKYIFTTPRKFIDVICNAECVYTSTLHGSIFTMLTHKKGVFTALMPKVRDIIKRFKQEDRILPDDISYEEFVKKIETPVNIDIIETAKNELKENGKCKLNKILEEIQNGN